MSNPTVTLEVQVPGVVAAEVTFRLTDYTESVDIGSLHDLLLLQDALDVRPSTLTWVLVACARAAAGRGTLDDMYLRAEIDELPVDIVIRAFGQVLVGDGA
jgi:hypothetical protein